LIPRKITDYQLQEYVTKGLHVTEIAQETGIHKSTISRRLKKLKLTRIGLGPKKNYKDAPPMALDKVFEVAESVEGLLKGYITALDEIIKKNTKISKNEWPLLKELLEVFQGNKINKVLDDEKMCKEFRRKVEKYMELISYSPIHLQKQVIQALKLREPIWNALNSIQEFLFNYSSAKEFSKLVIEEVVKESPDAGERIMIRWNNRQQELKKRLEGNGVTPRRTESFGGAGAKPTEEV
jgi:transposase